MLCCELMQRPEEPDVFGRAEHLKSVADQLRTSTKQAEALASAVFSAVQAEMPMEEVAGVDDQLPADLNELGGRRRQAA